MTSADIGTVDEFCSNDNVIEGPIDDLNPPPNGFPRITDGEPKDQRQLSLTETSQMGVCPQLKDVDHRQLSLTETSQKGACH